MDGWGRKQSYPLDHVCYRQRQYCIARWFYSMVHDECCSACSAQAGLGQATKNQCTYNEWHYRTFCVHVQNLGLKVIIPAPDTQSDSTVPQMTATVQCALPVKLCEPTVLQYCSHTHLGHYNMRGPLHWFCGNKLKMRYDIPSRGFHACSSWTN